MKSETNDDGSRILTIILLGKLTVLWSLSVSADVGVEGLYFSLEILIDQYIIDHGNSLQLVCLMKMVT